MNKGEIYRSEAKDVVGEIQWDLVIIKLSKPD